jgi:hypothetical protein
MSSTPAKFFALALPALLLPSLGRAYSIQQTPLNYTVKWSKLPIGYYVTSIGSDDVPGNSDTDAILASFADWEAIECSKLAFEQLGTTTTTDVIATGAAPNEKNELVFVEDSNWSFGEWVLGVTSPLTYISGEIFEADIAFNGYQTSWSTTGASNKSDVKSVAIHEIGHFFGLQHNLDGDPTNPPTMAPTADPYGRTASLEYDDELGACYLYPTGSIFSCTQSSQCPYVLDNAPDTGEDYYALKLVCGASVCKYESGGKGIGESCSGNDCAAPLFCQPVTGGSVCSKYCYTDFTSCPSGFACFAYQGEQSLGACLESDAPTTKANGQPCFGSADCASGLCVEIGGEYTCRQPCTKVNAASVCAGGEVCFVAGGATAGACVPKALAPSDLSPSGFPCNAGGECMSGICLKTPGGSGPQFCRDSCETGCSADFSCTTVNGQAVCLPTADLPADGTDAADGGTDDGLDATDAVDGTDGAGDGTDAADGATGADGATDSAADATDETDGTSDGSVGDTSGSSSKKSRGSSGCSSVDSDGGVAGLTGLAIALALLSFHRPRNHVRGARADQR